MITSKNLTVGQKVFIVTNNQLQEMGILKIGRQYIYLDDWWEQKIAIECIYPNNSERSLLFLSREDYAECEKLKENRHFIAECFSGYNRTLLTASQAERIRVIIEEPIPTESDGAK